MKDGKLAYVCSPYAGDIEYNIRMTIEYCRYAAGCSVIPLAPHLLMPRFLCEANPQERELGIQMGLRFLAVCSELWVFGSRISEGMGREIAEAERMGIPIRHVDESDIIRGVKDMRKYGIWAKRSAASVCGAAEAWLKSDGRPLTFDSYEEAAAKAESLIKNIGTPNVSYYPKELSQDLGQGPDEGPASGMSMKL
ncbi:MAG: hypothetical protein HPY50_03035 [Firmicutes bacterium]|nr:hypothetical protein [Bacillota bacterium]